jgi:hypothetical protein
MPNNITYDQTDTIVSGEAEKVFEKLGNDISEQQFKVRQDSLRLLMSRFGQENPAQSIYECAHEWSEKQCTTNGLVNYYNTYYNGSHDNT